MTEKGSKLGTIVHIVSGRADPTAVKDVIASLEDRVTSLERTLAGVRETG